MVTEQITSKTGVSSCGSFQEMENQLKSEDADPFSSELSESSSPEDEDPPGTDFKVKTITPRSRGDFMVMSRESQAFRDRYFRGVTDGDWNSWKWQLRSRIRSLEGLERMFSLSDDEKEALTVTGGIMPLAITPYYASLIDSADPFGPLRRTVIPATAEFILGPEESGDPLDEEGHWAAPGLFHRYPDRVLFLVTGICSVNCRYCTRSRIVSDESGISRSEWDQALDYIRIHPEVRDVLVSGGDPLTLSDESLEYLLKNLREIPHVEIIRIGTKIPMVLPQRITGSLVRMLKKYHPLWMSIHCTHPDEITPESSEACRRLADAGIPLGSQTVLLKGVNNSVDTLKLLYHRLMKVRVKPYYLYQCDPIAGSAHFRTTIKEGLDMIRGLRGFTSGYAVPHYVVDAPGGGGKIPLCPDYIADTEGGSLVLTNYEGKIYTYPDNSLSKEARI